MSEAPQFPDSFDAHEWAKAFVKLHGGDLGLMTAWFASALMYGYDRKWAEIQGKIPEADE